MLACVTIISLQSLNSGADGLNIEALYALSYGLLAPLLIALSIAIGRYWTVTCNYKTLDFTLDAFLVMAFSEIGFFIYFEVQTGYSS